MDLPSGKLNGLDLFSGIGGIAEALAPWVTPVAYCDIEKYSRAVLLDRMLAGELPVAPIWSDVRTLRKEHIPRRIDIISGGFPCQDVSVAGNGVGLEGKRSGLFFEIIRLACEFRPRFIFLENTPALTVRGLDRVLMELTQIGYDSRWTIVSAAELGAPHLRERIWILAHANGKRGRNEPDGFSERKDSTVTRIHGQENDPDSESIRRDEGRPEFCVRKRTTATASSCGSIYVKNDSDSESISIELPGAEGRIKETGLADDGKDIHANPLRARLQRWFDAKEAWEVFTIGGGGGGGGGSWPHWLPQPAIRRDSDGLRHRQQRITILGNSVVPQAAQEAFCRLIGFNNRRGTRG